MKRSAAVFVGLAGGCIAVLMAAENSPELPHAGYIWAALYLALGVVGYLGFSGVFLKRFLLLVVAAAVSATVVALMVSDKAYPFVGLLFAAPVVALVAAGGLAAALGARFVRTSERHGSNSVGK